MVNPRYKKRQLMLATAPLSRQVHPINRQTEITTSNWPDPTKPAARVPSTFP